MKKTVDKLKNKAKNNKLIILFLTIIALIGVIFGSVFIIIVSKSDQALIKEYIENFMNNIGTTKIEYLKCFKNALLSNMAFILMIWILGISIIGIPIIIFMYFSKCFILGFSVGAFILRYNIKGALLAFLYIFPHYLINIILYTLLTLYALKFSFLLLNSIIKRKTINFKIIMRIYVKIFLIVVVGIILTSLYETFIVTFIMSKLLFLIK